MTDQAEFEVFMRAYQNMVYSVAARLLGSEADALDVAQETFIKAHERFDQLRQNPSAGGWLKTVTTNLCLNHLSRYRARWRFFSEMFKPEDREGLDALLPAPDNRAEADDDAFRKFHLEKALQRLPSAQRVPLVLYHFDDLSYEEIAQKLGVSLSKVKTDIHRARESLRRWLKPDPARGNAARDARGSGEGLDEDFFGCTQLSPHFTRRGVVGVSI